MKFVPSDELDVSACVESGQVFRFRKVGTGWQGADGDSIVRAEAVDGGWMISSWPDEGAGVRLFQLEKSLADIQRELVHREPRLAPLVIRYSGLRLLKCARADETLFSFLCTPNNHLARITKMVNALANYGPVIADGYHAFPSIERVSEIPEGELRAKGFGYRARSIARVAQQVLAEPVGWLDGLRASSYADAHASLCRLFGIGSKIADCVCLFGLHHQEAVPLDVHMWRAACEWYFPEWSGKPLTQQKYGVASAAFRERFGELSGWAQQYLFYQRLLGTKVALV